MVRNIAGNEDMMLHSYIDQKKGSLIRFLVLINLPVKSSSSSDSLLIFYKNYDFYLLIYIILGVFNYFLYCKYTCFLTFFYHHLIYYFDLCYQKINNCHDIF